MYQTAVERLQVDIDAQADPLFTPLPGPQTNAYQSEAFITGYGGAAGGGKALSLDTPILTIDGWATMGDLEVGDSVFDENGEPCRVTGVTEVMHGRRVYAVEFDDGSVIHADADHQWFTSTSRERMALLRASEEWRARRRANRPSRATGKRSELFTATISARNAERAATLVRDRIPEGSIRTTEQIAASLMDGSHVNHAVSVAKPLLYPFADLPLDPYVLGAWLGDGTSTSAGFTTNDPEILDEIRAAGHTVAKWSGPYAYGIGGLKVELRRLGLLQNKHIPAQYLRASVEQRMALLQGLMDTDGTALPSGGCEFYGTNERLIRDVWELLQTLGIKSTVRVGRAMLNGKDCGPKYRIKFTTSRVVFRLPRKAERQVKRERGTQSKRFIVSVREIPSVPVRCISVDSPSRLYLAGHTLIPTHNSLLEIGLAVTQHRKSIIFRRHKEDVQDLWSKLRMLCGTVGRPNESSRTWQDLPGGRSVRLVGLQHEWDWQKYQGNENDYWAFDEATQFPELSIRTLIAWCRSPDPNQRCRVVLGFNPPTTQEGEWIIDFFAPWLDPAYPDPALPGELRWFARIDDRDVECEDGTPFLHDGELVTPLSRTFFPARLEDNPILDATNYRSVLQGMPEPLRSQMLYGDFTVGRAEDAQQVIPTRWIRAAQARWTPDRPEMPGTQRLVPQSCVSLDVAEGGRDRTVVARRYGDWVAELIVKPGVETPTPEDAVALVEPLMLDGGYAIVDADGLGGKAYGILRARFKRRAHAYQGVKPTLWRDRETVLEFLNVRAACYWALREALDPSNGSSVALPPDPELRAELSAARWERSGRKIKLEDKQKIKDRLGRSPDKADAVAMAFWPGATTEIADSFEIKVA